MDHAILFGEYELTVDPKHRILIPSDVRKSLTQEREADGFFVVIGRNRKPWLYPRRYYEFLVSSRKQDLTPNEDSLSFDQFHFAMSSFLEMDKQFRVLIPEKILSRTGTKTEVTIIGARDHLEIWNRAEWEARFEQLMNQSNEITLKAQQAQ